MADFGIDTSEATRYHKMTDNRYRGQCNECAESQQTVERCYDQYEMVTAFQGRLRDKH